MISKLNFIQVSALTFIIAGSPSAWPHSESDGHDHTPAITTYSVGLPARNEADKKMDCIQRDSSDPDLYRFHLQEISSDSEGSYTFDFEDGDKDPKNPQVSSVTLQKTQFRGNPVFAGIERDPVSGKKVKFIVHRREVSDDQKSYMDSKFNAELTRFYGRGSRHMVSLECQNLKL